MEDLYDFMRNREISQSIIDSLKDEKVRIVCNNWHRTEAVVVYIASTRVGASAGAERSTQLLLTPYSGYQYQWTGAPVRPMRYVPRPN